MAEQNVLAGNIAVMEQIISDFKEHAEKLDRVDKLNDTIKDLRRNIDVSERQIKEETDAKIKAAINSICEGYDKSIAADRTKIKEVQTARDKAKQAGVKVRIADETQGLRKENENLKAQIVEAFKTEKIPMFCNSRLYSAIFQTGGVLDYVIYIALQLALYVLIPIALMFIKGFPAWGYIVYYALMCIVTVNVQKIILNKTLLKHYDTITAARQTKRQIILNRKKIKKIERSIRSDKNEEMYGLENYDFNINELHDHIRDVEDEKAKALEEFEKTAKPDIISEIDKRSRNNINLMKTEADKKQEEAAALDELVKKQRIYISSNYEAYLGREFMNLDKLQELYSYMKSGVADTVGQALAAYKDRH